MRRVSNAVLMRREAKLAISRGRADGRWDGDGSGTGVATDVDTAICQVMYGAKRLVDDLSHDLRQPLSSLNMNVQSAIRCLRSPEPRVASALEALADCLEIEAELLAVLTAVQRHLSDELAESPSNDSQHISASRGE